MGVQRWLVKFVVICGETKYCSKTVDVQMNIKGGEQKVLSCEKMVWLSSYAGFQRNLLCSGHNRFL
jgi:hypothetical protein